MAMESTEANFRLIEDRLVPRADDIIKEFGDPPPITTEIVSILVGTDHEAADVLQDWESDVPDHYKTIDLKLAQRNKLQRRRLFLRNRRIVSGYELLDRRLRAQLGGGDPDAVPPTWLTVGKWTAKTIGDLLYGDIPIPQRRWALRKVLRFLLRLVSRWRTLAMGRIFILGNREIFAQVASVLATFTDTDFEKKLSFSDFVVKYRKCLLGKGVPEIADELPFPISAATRDPLSDSMLRALYSYYKAIDAPSEQERRTWVLTGNLHLASYEQRVAQTFVDLGLKLRTSKALRELLDGFKPLDGAEPARKRALDMVMEERFGVRLIDLAAAAFVTRYILSIRVGPAHEHDVESGQVFAPANPLGQCIEVSKSLMTLIDGSEAGECLGRIWFALDRADGRPDHCLVRDWRNYASRISYIANLFAVSVENPMFGQPVLSDDEIRKFLAGKLPKEDGIILDSAQLEAAQAVRQREEARAMLKKARKPLPDLPTAAAT